jgi:hypothetical protein
MLFFFNNSSLIIILTFIISIFSLKLKINGRQIDYCFKKTIYDKEDTIKIFYLISSINTENIYISLRNKEGKEIYLEKKKQKDEYTTDVLPSGEYTLCFEPRTANKYYITFDMQITSESSVTQDLAKDKEVKDIKNGVMDLENLFSEFENNSKFIADKRNHHYSILKNVVGSLKNITIIKIVMIISLSLFQVFIITKFFGKDKRVSTIKAGNKDFL